MIQLTKDSPYKINPIRLNLNDELTNTTYKPLISLTSQLSGSTKTLVSGGFALGSKERYVTLYVYIGSSSSPVNGNVIMGNTDFPYGLYDVTIYQNTSNTNLDPTGLTTVYTGLANFFPKSDNPAVEYDEYATNDTDTESVYITLD